MSLVSVITATYNSSDFIIETLDSIFNQTWEDIELIITDDNSSDDTVEVCRQWLNANSSRFIRTELITSEVNTGVSGNANRGLMAARGEWIKFIGADDTLLPDCLKDNMNFIVNRSYIRILFSRINVYNQSFIQENYMKTTPFGEITRDSILWHERTAYSQYRMLLITDRIHFSPSVFLHRKTLNQLGGFNEEFKLLEDYPLWLAFTNNGYKLYFMDKVTVNYRQHPGAINNTGRSFLINPNYFRAESFRKAYTYPFLPRLIRVDQRFRYAVAHLFKSDFMNRSNCFTRMMYNSLAIYLNPFRYIIKLKSLFKLGNEIEEFRY